MRLGKKWDSAENFPTPKGPINTEDFYAAIDYLSCRGDVDTDRISIIGICGWCGIAVNAAAADTRIKATLASTSYIMTEVGTIASDYEFRSVYLVTTSAEEGGDVARRAAQGLQGWIECFPKASFGGLLSGGGVTGANEAADREDLLAAAFEFGRQV